MPMSTSLKCKCKGRSKKCKNTTLRGGRTAIIGPKIKYKNGSTEHKLKCKCGKENFIVKTLTLGTKTKSIFGLEIFDNRFKVFTCTECGFVQLYSNKITCNGKQCDPL
jgi:predicted nucleic-acid-binding Zn-ribbon protein